MNASITRSAGPAISKRGFAVATAGLLLVAILWAALFIAQPATAKSAKQIKRATLSGAAAFPSANGEAKWTAKSGERELEVQIQDVKKLAGRRLTVKIGGTVVGHMRVSSLGNGRLVKRTAAGQKVPTSVAGKTVRITTSGGTLVASGQF